MRMLELSARFWCVTPLDRRGARVYGAQMIDPKLLDDLAKRVAGSVPTGLQFLQSDLQKNLRSALGAGLGRLDLVTREEYDVQCAVLARTREKLENLEKQLETLERELNSKGS